jgi:hypothetical protein
MKADTDQVIQLIKKAKSYTLSDLGMGIHSPTAENAKTFLKSVVSSQFDLPKGTIFKIRGLDKLFNRITFLFIVGDVKTGNIVVTIDHNCLDLETVLYQNVPDVVGIVKSIQFPNINSSIARKAIEKIIRHYKDMVNKIHLGLNATKANFTLLNLVFEFALTGTVQKEMVKD